MRFFIPLITLCVALASPANAEIARREGAVAHRSLPPPGISESFVLLDVPHLRQQPDLCVPTSAAMVLRYFGEQYAPRKLKALAEGYKPKTQRNVSFTYWRDMNHALSRLGYRWKIRNFPRTQNGFDSGLRAIKRHLRRGRPVLIEVHQGAGHTFVVIGYDDARQMVFVRDPNLPGKQSRVLGYSVLRENWHDHQFGPSRSAFFTFGKN